MGEKDEYTPMSLVARKSAQQLQSRWVEPDQTLLASVGKMIDMLQLQMVGLHMVGTCGLQEDVAEEVAQENTNMVGLHEKVQDRVDGHDLPVNQAVTAVDGGTEEELSPVGDLHEEMVQVGTSHAESVIVDTDKYTPTSMQSVMPRNVTGKSVTKI